MECRARGSSRVIGWGSEVYTKLWPPPAYGLLFLMATRADALWDNDTVNRARCFSNYEDDDVDLAVVTQEPLSQR